VAGANDTGMWEDSPSRSDVTAKELKEFRSILRKNRIRSVQMVSRTSNVFAINHYVLVRPEDQDRARELAKEYMRTVDTENFFVV
jgi:hypothetical protein